MFASVRVFYMDPLTARVARIVWLDSMPVLLEILAKDE